MTTGVGGRARQTTWHCGAAQSRRRPRSSARWKRPCSRPELARPSGRLRVRGGELKLGKHREVIRYLHLDAPGADGHQLGAGEDVIKAQQRCPHPKSRLAQVMGGQVGIFCDESKRLNGGCARRSVQISADHERALELREITPQELHFAVLRAHQVEPPVYLGNQVGSGSATGDQPDGKHVDQSAADVDHRVRKASADFRLTRLEMAWAVKRRLEGRKLYLLKFQEGVP